MGQRPTPGARTVWGITLAREQVLQRYIIWCRGAARELSHSVTEESGWKEKAHRMRRVKNRMRSSQNEKSEEQNEKWLGEMQRGLEGRKTKGTEKGVERESTA
eukprot:22981-Pleurochrysis_carterae.AAC.3